MAFTFDKQLLHSRSEGNSLINHWKSEWKVFPRIFQSHLSLSLTSMRIYNVREKRKTFRPSEKTLLIAFAEKARQNLIFVSFSREKGRSFFSFVLRLIGNGLKLNSACCKFSVWTFVFVCDSERIATFRSDFYEQLDHI